MIQRVQRMVRWAAMVVGVVVGLAASAREARAQAWEKGWLDVNFGVAIAAESEFTSARSFVIAQEIGAVAVAYGLPRGGSFDVGGGYLFTPRVGVGISVAGTAHQDVAGLGISVPHPLYFNASDDDVDVTAEALTRAEGAWHLHPVLVAVQTPRLRVRLFGGPSYFRAEQEVVTQIRYDQVFQLFNRGNVVNITRYDSEKEVGTGWGFHAGGDLSVFFNRVVGVGTVLRISRGQVTIADYGGDEDRKVGGTQIGFGLRLRF